MNSTSLPGAEALSVPRAVSAMNGLDRDSATHALTAAQRLEQSRLRLQRALTPEVHPSRQQQQEPRHRFRPAPDARHPLQGQRMHGPASAGAPSTVVQDWLAGARGWWSKHPLHDVGTLAVNTAEAAARPLVRQHPVVLLLAAAACGAAVAWSKPWRFLNRRVLAAALVPGVLPGLLPGLLRSLTPLLVPMLVPRVGPSLWAQLVHAVGALVPSEQPAAAVQPRSAETSGAPTAATAPQAQQPPRQGS